MEKPPCLKLKVRSWETNFHEFKRSVMNENELGELESLRSKGRHSNRKIRDLKISLIR